MFDVFFFLLFPFFLLHFTSSLLGRQVPMASNYPHVRKSRNINNPQLRQFQLAQFFATFEEGFGGVKGVDVGGAEV